MRVFYSLLATLFFMPRLDYSVFGLFLQRFDMGFMSYISFIHMEVNQKHPIKIAFCELVKRYVNSESYQSLSLEQRAVRNRWNLAYTMLKNPVLKRERKSYIKEERYFRAGKHETAKQFLKRKFSWNRKQKNENAPIELKYIGNSIENETTEFRDKAEIYEGFEFFNPKPKNISLRHLNSSEQDINSSLASNVKPRQVNFKSEIDVYESNKDDLSDENRPLYENPWKSN
jgi:hypothetical protein